MNASAVPQKTIRPYRKAFVWGGTWLAISTTGFALAYGHFSAEGFGRLFGMTMVSSAICGFLASRSKTPWSFWKIGGIYLLIALAVVLVSSYGARNR